jgi:hypothetical protein
MTSARASILNLHGVPETSIQAPQLASDGAAMRLLISLMLISERVTHTKGISQAQAFSFDRIGSK